MGLQSPLIIWFYPGLDNFIDFIFSPACSSEDNTIVIDPGDKYCFSAPSVEEIEAEAHWLGRSIGEGLLLELRDISIVAAAVSSISCVYEYVLPAVQPDSANR